MKRLNNYFLLVALVLIMLLFSGCSKNDNISISNNILEEKQIIEEQEKDKFKKASKAIMYNELNQLNDYDKVMLHGEIVMMYQTEFGNIEYGLKVIESNKFVGLIKFSNPSKEDIQINDKVTIYGYFQRRENEEYLFIIAQVIEKNF